MTDVAVHPEFVAYGGFGHLRLGRVKPSEEPKLRLAPYIAETFKPAPPTVDFYSAVPNFPMYGNDTLGDCTLATVGHMIEAWTQAAGDPRVPADHDIEEGYWLTGSPPSTTGTPGGATDDGRMETRVLSYWRGKGVPNSGDKIVAYAAVNPRNLDRVRFAVANFGGAYIGLAMPLTAETQKVWDVVPGDVNGEPGSWGGHCLAGDTPIALLDGTEVSLEQLAEERRTGIWVYGSDNDGHLVPSEASHVQRTGKKTTIRVVLDDDSEVRATPDHRFLLRDGSYREARDLRAGDSLMPLYRRMNKHGYEETWDGDRWLTTHHAVGRAFGFVRGRGWCIHHENFDKRDNRPENLRNMRWGEHRALHREQGALLTAYARSEDGRERSRVLMTALWADPEFRRRMREDIRPGTHVKTPGGGWWLNEKGKARLRSSQNLARLQRGREAASELASENRITRPCGYCGAPVTRAPSGFCSDAAYCSQGHYLAARFAKRELAGREWNHKVVAVERGHEEWVYDLVGSRPTSNFAAGGVYVHNCVPILGYDADYLYVVTWGAVLKMTWAFHQAYCDACYAVVSGDFVAAATAAGVNIAAMQDELAVLTAAEPLAAVLPDTVTPTTDTTQEASEPVSAAQAPPETASG